MANHKIALITDTTSDIPDKWRKKYDITVVPLFIIWGMEELRDYVDISPENFYERLVVDPIHPKTSQPSPQDFLNTYEKLRQEGAEEIVVITISGGLSGTLQSAKQAADMIDIPVHTLDSKSTSMGLGWQVLAAARAREAGGDAQSMIAAADKARKTMIFTISLDTLEYLHKGGRIGGASRFLGTMLKIKPQIYIDHQTGLIEAGERTRTRKKALESLYQEFFRQMDTEKTLKMAVLHTNALPEAQRIIKRIEGEISPGEIFMSTVSPVLGVHVGPRVVALCGYIE